MADADLLELGRQLDQLQRELLRVEERDGPRNDAVEQAIDDLPRDRHYGNEEFIMI